MRNLFLALFLMAATNVSWADGTLQNRISAHDKDRLARFAGIMTEAVDEARRGGSAADIAILDNALSGKPMPIAEGFDATGVWRCRTIKLGGILPLTVYPEFKCSIRDDGAGWFLNKLTGSQRTQGRFYTESTIRLIYLGTSAVDGKKGGRYGEVTREDQVAVVERRYKDRLIMMFPAPHFESKLDIMVLERSKEPIKKKKPVVIAN